MSVSFAENKNYNNDRENEPEKWLFEGFQWQEWEWRRLPKLVFRLLIIGLVQT